MPIDRITLFCFAASYAVALALEIVQLIWPRPVQRLAGLAFGGAGLLAHTLYLAVQRPSLASQSGSLLFLAWILAVFYLYGTIHHRRLAWAVFVLPLVLGLIGLASVSPQALTAEQPGLGFLRELRGERFWGLIHGTLLILAGVGICVGFVASIMYLIQAGRLKAKALPNHGIKLPSLERLEMMNRRAIIWAFPLLTAGVLVGIVMMIQQAGRYSSWADPRILGAAVLWLLFVVLLFLRYGVGLRGRQVALLTIVAFALLLFTLVNEHNFLGEGRP